MRTLYSTLRIVTIFCLILSHGSLPAFAQEEMHAAAATEKISLQVGDIFEILPIHAIDNATYTWILTQDRTFLEASRAPSFRKRLIQPGQYTLFAEIASQDGSKRFTRSITLDYAAREIGKTETKSMTVTGATLVSTSPAATANGKIAMDAETQILLLTPINLDITPLSLDLDLHRDNDGDGKNDNDIQARETFFHTDATPIYIWITNDPLTTHSISITAAMPDGARTQTLEILNEEIAFAQGAITSPIRIEAIQSSERTYSFTPIFENPAASAGQLLYQWQFGDGQQSLLTKPEHTYAEDGTYTVLLLVRNLRDGSEVASTSTTINVAPETANFSSSQVSSDVPEDPNPSTGNSKFNITSILMMVGLFLGSILLGILVIVVVGKLRKGKTSFADRLETIEQTVVKTPADMTAPLTIVPLVTSQVKRTEPPAEIAQREKEQEAEQPAPAPVVQKENTPAWLTPTTPKPTPAPAVVTPSAPKPTPTPAPVAPTVTPTPKAAVTPTPIISPASSVAQNQTPAWLQQPVPTPSAPNPAPTPKPSLPTPPQPKPVTPVQTPAPVVPPTPKPAAPVSAPTPAATPTTPTSAPAVAPVQRTANSVSEKKPTPAPVVNTPSTPEVKTAPSTNQQPKSPQPVSEPIVLSPAKETPTVEIDIPAASDLPIAIIRAESLNPPSAQNG